MATGEGIGALGRDEPNDWRVQLRRHRRLLAVSGGLIAVVAALLGAAWGYDRAQRNVIANGVRLGPISLGGLSAQSAKARLTRALAVTESRRLVLVAGHGRLALVPSRHGVGLDIDGIVARALAVSRRGSFLSRDWRALTGGSVHASLAPELTPGSARELAHFARRLERRPHNAVVAPSAATLHVFRSRSGSVVAPATLHRAVATALLSGTRRAKVPVHRIAPHLTVTKLRRRYPSYVTIDRGNFTLRVYQHLHLVRSYPIAVGMQGLQTPAGLYHIQDKQVDPSWDVPNSPWAGSLAGQVIPPGPQDPLKARWMGLFNGAGIHGTDETDSIGHAFSHGCVRMLIPDVIDLYNRVQVNTPVYIGN